MSNLQFTYPIILKKGTSSSIIVSKNSNGKKFIPSMMMHRIFIAQLQKKRGWAYNLGQATFNKKSNF